MPDDGINPAPRKTRGIPLIVVALERLEPQKDTLMSPEIAVGWGMSFSPTEFCQS